MRWFALVVLLLPAMSSAEPVAAVVDIRIREFERSVDAAFVPVRQQLDAWRERRARTAQAEVSAMLAKAGPRDRIYLAYALLASDPRHRQARKVYADLGLPPPFDDQGVRVPGAKAPGCDTAEAVAKAVELSCPSFDAVAKAVDLRGSAAAPFWRRLAAEQESLRKDLVRIAADRAAEQAAATVYPLLAYYQPDARDVKAYYAAVAKPVPRQRSWFNPVDRWLLDHELAGIDALRQAPARAGKPAEAPWPGSGSGTMPAVVPGAAVEVVGLWQDGARIVLSSLRGSGVAWTLGKGRITIAATGAASAKPPVQAELDVDLGAVALPVRCSVRGTHAAFAVGDIEVAALELPVAVALQAWSVQGVAAPHQLRIRFLGESPELLDAGQPAAPATPAAPAWMAERQKQLAAVITCELSDQPLSEAVALLSQVGGATFRLAPSAESLADLPVTLSARGVPLRTALEWLQRLAEIEAVPEEAGFRLEWRRSARP